MAAQFAKMGAMSFVRQHPFIWVFLRLLVFRESPDVLPASWFLFGLVLVINLLIDIVSFLVQFDLPGTVLRTIADLIFSALFIYLLLLSFNKAARFLQTAIAMFGVSALLNLFALPLLVLLPPEQKVTGMAGTILYTLFFWHIFVIGHIFRHALAVNFALGLLASFAYVLLVMTVFYSLFPVQ